MPSFTLKDAIDPDHPASKFSNLHYLMQEQQVNQRLLKILKSTVNPKFKDHILYASIRGNTLNIIVDASSWAMLIRADSRRLIKELRQLEDFCTVDKIRIQNSRTRHRSRH